MSEVGAKGPNKHIFCVTICYCFFFLISTIQLMKCKNYWENAFEINLTSWQDHGADVKIVVVKGHPLEAFITTSSLWYLAIFFFLKCIWRGKRQIKTTCLKVLKSSILRQRTSISMSSCEAHTASGGIIEKTRHLFILWRKKLH